MKKSEKYFNLFVGTVSLAVFALIFIFVFFVYDKIIFACKREFILPNIALLLLFLVSLFVLIILRNICKNKIKINCDKAVKIVSIILFFVSLYISYNIFFETGWDSGSAIIPAARFLAVGDNSILGADYFSYYPNNSLLILIYSYILKFNDTFGIFTGDNQLMSIVVVNVLFSTIATFLTYKVAKKLFGKTAAVAVYLMTAILVNLSPWNVICYSDSFSLIFPILIAYLYICTSLKPLAKYMCIFALGTVGYMIKPQNVIIVIAVIITDIFRYVRKENLAKILKIVLVCAVVLTGVKLTVDYSAKQAGFNADKDKKIGAMHFFMMGLNNTSLGGYNSEDAQMSFDCQNQETRNQMNRSVAISRLKTMGVTGYGKLLMQKTLTNYGDGLFAWGMEGQFYYRTFENKNQTSSPVLKNIFYTHGANFNKYALLMQFLWLSMLTLIFGFLIINIKQHEKNYNISVLMLALLGLTAFELLFEARARYLYAYVPVYAVIAAGGIKMIFNIVDNKKFRRKEMVIK